MPRERDFRPGQRLRLPSGRVVELIERLPSIIPYFEAGYCEAGEMVCPGRERVNRLNLTIEFLQRHAKGAV